MWTEEIGTGIGFTEPWEEQLLREEGRDLVMPMLMVVGGFG